MSHDLRGVLAHGKLHVNFTMMDVLGHIIIWTILSIITFGIGGFFWPYAALKLIINNLEIQDNTGARVGKFNCTLSAGQQIGHILLWLILTVITFGLAFPFYLFGVVRTAFNQTEII